MEKLGAKRNCGGRSLSHAVKPSLRISSKKDKHSPRIVFRFGKQDENVKDFLNFRKIIRKSVKNCGKSVIFERSKRYFS
jgi:hypothetical protein